MKKAVSIQTMFTNLPFYERFAEARKAGFDLVEFGDWTQLDLGRVAEELAANNLRLSSVMGADTFDLTDPDVGEEFLEYLSQSIAVAKSFACRNLIVQSADKRGDDERGDASPTDSADFSGRAAATRALMDAAKKAERAGATLFLKPMPMRGRSFSYLHTNPSAGSVVKVINSPALRLLFSITHMRTMDDDSVAALRKYKDQVGYVHVGAAAPGSGDIDPRLVKTILEKELGYDGIIGFVLTAGENGRVWLEQAAAAF